MADYNLGLMNPYNSGAVDATMSDMARNYNLLSKPQEVNSSVKSGSFGNSGLLQMQQNSDLNQQQAMGNVAANMRDRAFTGQQQFGLAQDQFDAGRYDQSFNQNQQNIQTAMGLLGAQNGYNQQDIGNSTNIQNAPLNYYNQFSNMANAAGGQGTSQTTNMPGNPFLGALGGWSLGNAFANPAQKATV